MEKLKAFLKFIKPYINKYTIVIALFIVFMFIGKYSVIERVKLYRSVSELEKEKEQYEKDIIQARKELLQLNTTKENLERLAREKHLMRKQNEEVFIIDEEKIKAK